MGKQSDFMRRLSAAQAVRDMAVREHFRVFILDIVTITLGKCGMSPEEIEKFRDTYMQTEDEYCDEITADYYGNGDKMICYAKDRIDRAIREYVTEDMFVPYDKRYRM